MRNVQALTCRPGLTCQSLCLRRRWCLVALLLSMLMPSGYSIASASAAPGSVAFWYADNPPLAELSQFEWAILEPAHAIPSDIDFLRSQGSQPFAYLSVGEYDGDINELESSVARGASEVRNEAWSSQVMLLTSPAWRHHLLRRAEELANQGYAGLFLDTLDSFQLLPEGAREAQRQALRQRRSTPAGA